MRKQRMKCAALLLAVATSMNSIPAYAAESLAEEINQSIENLIEEDSEKEIEENQDREVDSIENTETEVQDQQNVAGSIDDSDSLTETNSGNNTEEMEQDQIDTEKNISVYMVYDHYWNDWNYVDLADNDKCITGYVGADSDIVIPDEITGRTVVTIGARAFLNHSNLTKIKIPQQVRGIGEQAFEGCSNLKEIELPEIKKISRAVFASCTSLEKVIMPQNIQYIDAYAFCNCSSLSSIVIPSSVTSIGTGAFQECTSLSNVEIPEGMKEIRDNAFDGCSNLNNITIPKSVYQIDGTTFNNCGELTIYGYKDSFVQKYVEEHNSHCVEEHNHKLTFKVIGTDENKISIICSPEQQFYVSDTLDKHGLDVTIKGRNEAEIDKVIASLKYTNSDNTVVKIEKGSVIKEAVENGKEITWALVNFNVQGLKEGESIFTITLENGVSASCKVKVVAQKEITVFDPDIYRASYLYDNEAMSANIYSYLSGETPSEKICSDKELVAVAKEWKFLQDLLGTIDDPSNILDKPLEKKDMYEAIIFDLFESSSSLSVPLEEQYKEVNKLVSIIKKEYETAYNIKISEDADGLKNLTASQKKNLLEVQKKVLEEDKGIKIAGAMSKVSNAINYFDDVKDWVEYTQNCANIVSQGESYINILEYMCENCPQDNPDLKAALKEVRYVTNNSLLDMESKMSIRAIGVIGKDAVQFGIGEIWDGAKESLYSSNPYFALYEAAYKGATFVSNAVWNTDSTAESILKMAAVQDIRPLLRKAEKEYSDAFSSSRSKENAENYLALIDIYFRHMENDCKAAYDFGKTISAEKNKATEFVSLFGKDNIETSLANIKSIENSYKNVHTSTKTLWVEGLSADYPERYKYYADQIYDEEGKVKKRYTIKCPVDVYVYDESGNLAASVVGTVASTYDENITIAVVDEKKEIWLNDDAEQYTIHYIGNGSGKMDITVKEQDSDGSTIRTIEHTDIPLKKGTEYVSENATYVLKNVQDNNEIYPVSDTDDDSIPTYILTVTNGYITDGIKIGYTGEYHAGQRVTVHANIPDGKTWDGWKSDDISVTSFGNENTISFTMPAHDVKLNASYVGQTSTPVDDDSTNQKPETDQNQGGNGDVNKPSEDDNADKTPGTDSNQNGTTDNSGESGNSNNGSTSSGSSGSRGGSHGSSRSNSSLRKPTSNAGTWMKNNTGWWYQRPDGTWPHDEWCELEYLGRKEWYYFDKNGYVASGWLKWNECYYYLNPISDGWFGRMETGWKKVDGKWYYLEPVAGQNKGHLFVNTVTPDGYKVDSNGAWIE